jgi:TetR/AcrR family transcriptional repressor of nem operon
MPYSSEHRERVREKIVQSARRLFNRKGFNAVSIDDVMADAGLTRGSFYAYFDSKSDLYATSITAILSEKSIEISDGLSIDPRAPRSRRRSSATICPWGISRISTAAARW